MSRKISISFLVATVLVLVLAGFAWAQTPDATEVPTTTATVGCPSGNFVDNDGDGVCDNRDDAATGQQWGPNTGSRMGGMMRGGMMQSGQNFVDADEDGVCDHMEDGTGMQRNNATRHGMGRMGNNNNGTGNGMNNGTGRGWHR